MRGVLESVDHKFLTAVTVVLALAGCALDPGEAGHLVPETVDEDRTLPAIEVNGTRLHIRSEGDVDDPLVLFMHGGPGSSLFGQLPFADQGSGAASLTDYRLVFWDQRGAGLSRRHSPEQVSMAKYRGDLAALVDNLSPHKPIVLAAYSFGAVFALDYANHFPERVRGLVLISPAPLDGQAYLLAPFTAGAFSEGVSDILWTHTWLNADDHAQMDYQMALSAMDALHPDFAVDPDRLPSFRRWGAVCQWAIYEELGLIPPPKTGEAPEFDVRPDKTVRQLPVLAFAGGEDRMFSPDFVAGQLQNFEDAALVTIPGWGHDIGFAYDELRPHIAGFLARLEAGQ